MENLKSFIKFVIYSEINKLKFFNFQYYRHLIKILPRKNKIIVEKSLLKKTFLKFNMNLTKRCTK